MLVKLCSLLPLAIPDFHGRRGQAKTFAPKYCPGGGNIYSLSLAYFPSPRLGAGFGKGGGGGLGDFMTRTLLFVIIASPFLPLPDWKVYGEEEGW